MRDIIKELGLYKSELDAQFIPPKRPRRYRTEEERQEARRETWRRANKKYRDRKKAEKEGSKNA